jgi:hypothetical protein
MTIEDYLDGEDLALWRRTERLIRELAVAPRISLDPAAGQFAALAAESRETDRRLHELGEATDARIAALLEEIRGATRANDSVRE